MILLNFSQSLTADPLPQMGALAGQKLERVIEVHNEIDPHQPLIPQVVELADAAGLDPAEWQTVCGCAQRRITISPNTRWRR